MDRVFRIGFDRSRWFAVSSGVILTVTGVAKIYSGCGVARVLMESDPVFGVTFRQLFLLVGFVEITIALVCFLDKHPSLSIMLVAWLASSFLVYRLGLTWIGWHRPCNCLGALTGVLRISPEFANNTMKVLATYLLIGSYAVLITKLRAPVWIKS